MSGKHKLALTGFVIFLFMEWVNKTHLLWLLIELNNT